MVTGTIRVGATAGPAYTDLVAAYNEVAGRTGGAALAGDLNGLTLAPGLYSAAGAVANTGTVTLDGGGNPNAVFVFQVGGALNMAAGAQVTLTNGAQASNVFWQVNGAAAVGANAKFAGTLMALTAIAVGAGTRGQRPRAGAQRRDLARLQRVLQRSARRHDRRRGDRDHEQLDPDDQRHDRSRGPGGRDRDDRRADPHRDAVRRRMVGAVGDPGERHLCGRRVGHRRRREPRAAPPNS